MNDRELLELAAKASGFDKWEWVQDALGNDRFHVYQTARLWLEWSPLTDDGDALRLAVKLGMNVDISENRAAAIGSRSPMTEELIAGDPLASTRRAIVRAAAEIGRATQ